MDARIQRNIDKIRAAGLPESEVTRYLQSEGVGMEQVVTPEPEVDPTLSGGMLSGLANATLGWGPKFLAAGQTIPTLLAEGPGAWNEAYGEQATANLEAMRDYEQEHPVYSGVGSILGGLGTGLGAGAVARLPATLSSAIGLGGLEGILYGSGTEENELEGAGTGGVVGAIASPVGYAASQGAQRVIGSAIEAITPKGAERFAIRKIGQRIDPEQARLEQSAYGNKPFMLADVGEQSRGLARASTSIQGKGRDIGIDAVTERAEGRFPRTETDLQRTFLAGTPEAELDAGPSLQRRMLANERAATVSPEYRQVVDEFGEVEITPELANLLKRNASRQGIRSAQESASNRGLQPMSIRVDDETGEVTGRVTFRDLDMIQRGMRQTLENMRDPVTGRLVGQGGGDPASIQVARSDLLDAMNRLNPDYRAVRGQWADFSAQDKAFERGRNILREDFGDIGLDVDDMSPAEKEMFTRGIFNAFRNRASTASDPSSRAQWNAKKQRIVEKVLPPERAALLKELMDRERAMTRTDQSIMGGSPTARIQEEIADLALNPETLLTTAIGGPAAANENALRQLAGLIQTRMQVVTERRAEEIAKRLLSSDPQVIRQTLDAIERVSSRQQPMGLVSLGVGTAASRPTVDFALD